MRTSPGLPLRRAIVGGSALAAFRAPGGPASAEPPAARTQTLPFTQRYHALQYGGIVRAANSSISCRSSAKAALPHGSVRTAGITRATAPTCPAVRGATRCPSRRTAVRRRHRATWPTPAKTC